MEFYPDKVWNLTLHIAISGVLFCYTLSVLNTSADNVGATLGWNDMQYTYTAIFSSIVPIGSVFGALVTGSMTSVYGRRGALMIADIIMIIGCSIVIIPYTICFGLGRFITGIAAGLFLTINPIFINEVTPDQMTSVVGPLIQISTDLGLILSFGMGIALPASNFDSNNFNYWWMFMFFFPAILSGYQFFYFWKCHPYDSPLWLLHANKRKEALEAVSQIYTHDYLERGIKRFESNIDNSGDNNINENNTASVSYKQIFSDFKYRKMLRVGICLAFIQQFSGVNAVVIYSTSIIEELDQGLFMSRVYTFIMGFVFFISSVSSIPLLNKYGRKDLLIWGQILLAIDYLLLSFFTKFYEDWIIVAVILLNFFYINFAYSLGAALWLYLSEALLGKILGISATINLVLVCVVSGIFPIAADYFGIYYIFLFFSLCMATGSIYSNIDLFETKGITKSEILGKIYFR